MDPTRQVPISSCVSETAPCAGSEILQGERLRQPLKPPMRRPRKRRPERLEAGWPAESRRSIECGIQKLTAPPYWLKT